jgi:protein-disulfide isomerase
MKNKLLYFSFHKVINMGEDSGKTIKIKIPKLDIWRILTIVFAVIILAQLFGFFNLTGLLSLPASTLSSQKIGENVVNYINQNLVQPGTKVSLISVEDVGGVYKIMTSYQGQQIPVYASKDGRFLFLPQGTIDMTETRPTQQTQEQPQQEVPKTDRPEARVFIMSYCPYGLQFLKAYIPVIELLGNKADLYVNFVDYAMHGDKEIEENTRMYCIQKEQRDKFTSYLRCFVQSGNASGCIAEAKIDKAKLDACMQATDKQYNITGLSQDRSKWLGNFPPYPIDSELNDRYGVQGSPTFVLNGVTISVNRAAESIKQAICSAFKVQPPECSQKLSVTTESPGIGPMGSGSGASSGGKC